MLLCVCVYARVFLCVSLTKCGRNLWWIAWYCIMVHNISAHNVASFNNKIWPKKKLPLSSSIFMLLNEWGAKMEIKHWINRAKETFITPYYTVLGHHGHITQFFFHTRIYRSTYMYYHLANAIKNVNTTTMSWRKWPMIMEKCVVC